METSGVVDRPDLIGVEGPPPRGSPRRFSNPDTKKVGHPSGRPIDGVGPARRVLRTLVLVCALLVLCSVLQSAVVRGADPDSDGDGLTDSYELTTLYTQRVAAAGLPKGIIDNGVETAAASLLPWQGVVNGAFAEFTIDYPAKTELTVQVGYWSGTAWVDRYVWDPGSRLLGVSVTQPAANAFVQGTITAASVVVEDEIVDRVEFYLGGGLIATARQPASAETYSIPIDTVKYQSGTYELKAVAVDKVGATRASAITVKIDNAIPSVSISSPTNAAIGSGLVSIQATATDDFGVKEVQFYVDGAWLAVDNTAPYAASWDASTKKGSHTIKAVAVDYAGKSASNQISVTVDNAYPSVSFGQPSSGSYVKGTYRVKVRATDDNGINAINLKVDSGSYFSIKGNFDGTYYWYDWNTVSVSGSAHSLTAQATDTVGKVSTAVTVSVTVDNTAPSVAITYPANGATVFGKVMVTASASDNAALASVAFYVDNYWRVTDTQSPYEYAWYTPWEFDGGHTVKAVAADSAGSSAIHEILVKTANWGGGGGCVPPCPTSTDPMLGFTKPESGTTSLTTTTARTTSGYAQVESVSTVVADLLKPRSQVTQVERDNRLLPTEFSPSLVHSQLSWRIVIRDWVPSTTTQGSLTAYSIRLEERSDPAKADTDGDGLRDGAEVTTYGTYPTTVDADGDGARDDFEVVSRAITYFVNGVARSAAVKTSPTNADTDGDGLSDGEEYNPGVDRVVTNPVVPDTDGDLLTDGAELLTHNSNATLTDTDKDTITDYTEVTARTLTLTVNGATQYRTVKTLAYAEDSDGDGLRDDKEWSGTSVYGVKTDPSDYDTDDDGLADGQEKFATEISLSTRKTVGTSLSVPLTVSVSGAIERVDVRYGLSTIDVSNFYVRLDKGTTSLVLRNRQGTGLYNYSSKEITNSFVHGGTYSLYVSSPVSGGVLEEFALSLTLRTSPIRTDTDGDGLNDSEETTYGSDAWLTDPNRADTDGDFWSDGYEVRTKGTNPLSTDTDQDGARDSNDLDPLRNLLVAVRVNGIHHGNGPWCSPELVGIARVNNDYTWVTQHRIANLDAFTSWSCPLFIPTTQYSTASFYYTYYADVPDDASYVSLRATAWAINPGRGDDILVDQFVGYTLGSGTAYFTLWNGNSWYSFDAWTQALPKAKTLLITDGNATVTASNGQKRLTAQDRYFVLALDLTTSYGPLAYGVNAIVVPRSIFLDTKLKADFAAGSHWPLADATLYGQDLGRSDISKGIAGLIAKTITGADAYNVLDGLLRNKTNAKVFSYIDLTSYAVLANLPADVVKVLPWAGVANGPTGAMPQDFWQKIGAAATTVVNSLVYVGQLIYKGLVALGTFLVNLAEAIAEWGMRALGQLKDTVVAVAQKAGEVLGRFVDWIIDMAINTITTAIAQLLNGIKALMDGTVGRFVRELEEALATVDVNDLANKLISLAQIAFVIVIALAMIPVAIRVASVAIKAVTAGVSWIVEAAISEGVAEFIVRILMSIAFALATTALFSAILETMGWVEDTTVAFFKTLGLAATAIYAVSKVVFKLYESLFVKTANDISIIQRYKGFAFAIFGLFLVFIGSSTYAKNGLGRLAVDFAGFAFQAYGFWLYAKSSKDPLVQIGDFVAPVGSAIEHGVTVLSPPLSAAKITLTWNTGGYA